MNVAYLYFNRKINVSETEHAKNDNNAYQIVDKICKEDINYINARRLYIFKNDRHTDFNYFKCGNLDALKPVNKNLINYDINN